MMDFKDECFYTVDISKSRNTERIENHKSHFKKALTSMSIIKYPKPVLGSFVLDF